MLGDFEEETVTSCGYILDCSILSLTLPLPSLTVSYTNLETSSIFDTQRETHTSTSIVLQMCKPMYVFITV